MIINKHNNISKFESREKYHYAEQNSIKLCKFKGFFTM